MITALTLENFKGHASTRLALGRITVLVGPNAAGKSTVLEALHLAARMASAKPSSVLRDAHAPELVLRRGAARMRIALEADGPGGPVVAAVDVAEAGQGARPGALGVPRWTFRSRVGDAPAGDGVGDAPAGDDLALLEAAAPEEPGRSAHAVLASLSRTESYRFDGATGVVADPGAGSPTADAPGLLGALRADRGPRLVLCDNLGRGLHPAAQVDLARQLRAALAERSELQIVATTHSPYVLDELAAEDVRVFAFDAAGAVAAKKLSEHPDAASYAGSLTTGQLWTLEPEQRWVVLA